MLLLIFSFVFSSTVSASASTNYDDEISPCIDFVANITVVSTSGGGALASVGYNDHSFIVIENISSSSITVGHMSVPAGSSVTVGTFGNRSTHTGIWYNIEGYTGVSYACYGLTTGLTSSELSTVNSKINANDTWTLTKNCSYFAKQVWNSIASSSYQISGGNPADIVTSIKSKQYYLTNPTIPSKSKSSIAYQTSSSITYSTAGATAH